MTPLAAAMASAPFAIQAGTGTGTEAEYTTYSSSSPSPSSPSSSSSLIFSFFPLLAPLGHDEPNADDHSWPLGVEPAFEAYCAPSVFSALSVAPGCYCYISCVSSSVRLPCLLRSWPGVDCMREPIALSLRLAILLGFDLFNPHSVLRVSVARCWRPHALFPLCVSLSLSALRGRADEAAVRQYFNRPRIIVQQSVLYIGSTYYLVSSCSPSLCVFVVGRCCSLVLVARTNERSRICELLSAYNENRRSIQDATIKRDELEPFHAIPHLSSIYSNLLSTLSPCFSSPALCGFSLLVCGQRRSGKRRLLAALARGLCVSYVEINSYDVLLSPCSSFSGLCAALHERLSEAAQRAPCIIHIRRLNGLMLIAQSLSQREKGESVSLSSLLCPWWASASASGALIAASTDKHAQLNTQFKAFFTETIHLDPPNLAGREHLLVHSGLCASFPSSSARSLASRTAGYSWFALNACLAESVRIEAADAQQGDSKQQQHGDGDDDLFTRFYCSSGVCSVRDSSVAASLSSFNSRLAAASGTLSGIPTVQWADIGGLDNVKREIVDAIELPSKFPQLFASGVRKRAGLLLFGPPGTGKTLIAKAVASECGLNFLSVKGPELLNMYIGESEKNVRAVFARARSASPCVLFFDELDSLAPARGGGSDGGGVMDRVVSQLLTELDGIDANGGLFVIGATNRPDLLDSSLLRPGRLDRCVYLGLSATVAERVPIIKALTRKFPLHSDIDFHALLENAQPQLTGADFYALAADALMLAIKRHVLMIQQWAQQTGNPVERIFKHNSKIATPFDPLAYSVSQQDFITALSSLTPSISAAELAHYERLRVAFAVQPN